MILTVKHTVKAQSLRAISLEEQFQAISQHFIKYLTNVFHLAPQQKIMICPKMCLFIGHWSQCYYNVTKMDVYQFLFWSLWYHSALVRNTFLCKTWKRIYIWILDKNGFLFIKFLVAAYHSSMGRKHFDNAQSRILQFADSLFQSREIMNGTKKESSVSNLAASLMKGRRVLARRDADGLYYLGRVIEVVSLAYFSYIQWVI